MSEEIKTIVLDFGSEITKAGFSGEQNPRVIVPSVVGTYRKNVLVTHCFGHKGIDWYHCDEAVYKQNFLDLVNPVQKGFISSWDHFEIYIKLLRKYDFAHNGMFLDDNSVLIIETSFNPKFNREHITELMFETYNVSSFYIENQALLSLLNTGRDTGIVVEAGGGMTNIAPIYEGNLIYNANKVLPIGGRKITTYFEKLLKKSNCPLENKDYFTYNEAKEKNCLVAYDYEKEMANLESLKDDDKKISFDKDKMMAPELLFKPNLNGYKFEGIDQQIVKSIMECDQSLHNIMFSNVVLSGGNSLLNGLSNRLRKELALLTKKSSDSINIIEEQNRQSGAWIGGSILASNEKFKKMLIYKDEYCEVGNTIVNQKCK